MLRIQIEDPTGGRSIRIFRQPRVVIGRQEDCDLILADVMVSKVHAEIVQEAGKFLLRDLDSSNGTVVNGQWTVEAGLSSGDRIRIGKTELVFFAGAEGERGGDQAQVPLPRKQGAAPAPRPAARSEARAAGGTAPPVPGEARAAGGTAPPAPGEARAAGKTAPPAPGNARAAGEFASPEPPARFSLSSRLVIVLFALSGTVIILIALVVALLFFLLRSWEGETDRGRHAAEDRTSPPAAAAPAPPTPSTSSGGVLPPVEPGGLVALFEEKAEYILLARCGRCHDGSRGGSFLLHDGFEGSIRSAFNLVGLRSFLDWKSPGESRLLLKGSGKVPHGGGTMLSGDEAARIASFLAAAAGSLEGGMSSLFPPRPPFHQVTAGVPPEKEILIRRIFLDLLGRPPLRAEVEANGPRALNEALDGLMAGDEYRRVWKDGAVDPLREVWGEEEGPRLPRGDLISRLAALYTEKLEGRPPRRKTPARMAKSLVVDLLGRIPDEEEIAALEEALKAADGETLPLAAFLLGEVGPPAEPGTWIDSLHVRFLLRMPEPAERVAAQEVLQGKGGARILVLGLASSPGYGSD